MATWIVGSLVVVLIALAARSCYRQHKNGKGCCANCSGCSAKSSCSSEEKDK